MEKITGVVEIAPDVLKLPVETVMQILTRTLASLHADLAKKILEAKKNEV